jgi:hypothetical protein
MLTREEAINCLETGCCQHWEASPRNWLCTECRIEIVNLLKQQLEQPREIKEFLTLTEASGGHRIDSIIAICTDKTAWRFNNEMWHKLPPIPQDDVCKHSFTLYNKIDDKYSSAICNKCGFKINPQNEDSNV